MEGSWWKSRNELDASQEAIIMLPPEGRYIVTGPPGCGKTNLLVLRAAYLNKAGYPNLKLLTFGVALNRFIQTGVEGKGLDNGHVDREVRWGLKFALHHNPAFKDDLEKIPRDDLKARRLAIASECRRIQSQMAPGSKPHQAILVDEVQDLYAQELDVIHAAADRLMLAGDSRQRVFEGGTAMQRALALGFVKHELTGHYRMGTAIARVADKIYEPAHPSESLSAKCNYDENKFQSSAQIVEVSSRDEQFSAMLAKLRTQLKAYNKEILGVLVAKKTALLDLHARFAQTDIQDQVVFHDESDADFTGDGRIHVMTIAAAKGTEFRAVHLYATEDVSNRQDNQGFWYTAVTRAKTSLTAYASPGARPLSAILRAGFAQTEQLPNLDSLFEQ